MNPISDQIEFSVETPEGPSSNDEARRARIRAGWVYGGFASGILVGFAVTAASVAVSGYGVLPVQLIWNLMWAPALGVILGFRLGRIRGSEPWNWKRMRLRTRTMMVIVAYVALLFGMGVSTGRLGHTARQYESKFITSGQLMKVYQNMERLVPHERGAAHLRKLVDYHNQLVKKYDRARRRPWLPVSPDPPPPK